MTIVTLVDVIEIGFLFCPAHTLNPPLTPQTQRWFLQDLTITRGAFNQSGMQLGGASDGSGGRKGLITPSQSLSLVPFLFVPLLSLPPSLLFLSRPFTFAFLHGPSPVISATEYLNSPSLHFLLFLLLLFFPSLPALHV